MDVKLLIVAHKPYWMPTDPLYLPIQVGNAPAFLPTRDDTGDHIAGKNPTHCELTAVYWAWKNLPADAVGLAHYRRHFAEPGTHGPAQARVLRHETAERLLAHYDILLPRPRHYYIETSWSQYAHAHHEDDLRAARNVLAALHPEQLPAFDAVMRRTAGHRFNMFIMRRPALDAYCAWLFPLLDALEAQIDPSGYDDYNRRVFGFLAERLLDVWLETTGYAWTELPVCYLEKQPWLKKGVGLIRRKIRSLR